MDPKLLVPVMLCFFCRRVFSPWVSVTLQVLPEVPKEMLLREEQSHAQRQQLPALQEEEVKGENLKHINSLLPLMCICFVVTVRRADLCEGVVVWRPPVGLLDELTVHLVLQLRVGQAHLQSVLGQRGVVIDRRRLDQHVDEELTGLREKREKTTS